MADCVWKTLETYGLKNKVCLLAVWMVDDVWPVVGTNISILIFSSSRSWLITQPIMILLSGLSSLVLKQNQSHSRLVMPVCVVSHTQFISQQWRSVPVHGGISMALN